jgi:hypothetical protein
MASGSFDLDERVRLDDLWPFDLKLATGIISVYPFAHLNPVRWCRSGWS